MNQQLYSVQDWLPFEKILDNGIIKIKNSFYIKIQRGRFHPSPCFRGEFHPAQLVGTDRATACSPLNYYLM